MLDSSGVFDIGQRSGKWTFRDSEANKQLEGRYENGLLSNLIAVSALNDFDPKKDQYDIIDREWTEWYSNGEKRVQVIYESGGEDKLGKGSGTWNLWFENGNDEEE